MSTDVLTQQAVHEHHDTGATKVFGFWIYLMSDCILFAVVFATYAVLVNNVANGPTGKEIFELRYVLLETFCLLFSSVTYGMAMLAQARGRRNSVLRWLLITFVFGLAFICLELNEFHQLIAEGHTPQVSGFLSAFFTLVGTHGLHVMAGLLWMAVLMIQIGQKGLTAVNHTRLMCLSLFWHFLDIVWICVFTIVYLLGAM